MPAISVKRLLFVGVAMALGIAPAQADVPTNMTIQGRLSDAGGSPLGSTPVDLYFKIFDDPLAGSVLWPVDPDGEMHALTTDAGGLWTLTLGSVYAIPDSIFGDTSLWLYILVVDGINPDTELPRIKLNSGPFVFRSAWAQKADTALAVAGGGAFLPLSGGTMTGPIGNTGDPDIMMGKGNFGSGNTNAGTQAFVAGQFNNSVGDWSTVGGGVGNSAADEYAVVAGGTDNEANNGFTAIGGGGFNVADGYCSGVAGGLQNLCANTGAFIGGGKWNRARGLFSTIAGGGGFDQIDSNSARGDYSVISGGRRNLALGLSAVVCGGSGNQAEGNYAFIGGGEINYAPGYGTVIAGGYGNTADLQNATVGGGAENHASGTGSTVGGGSQNTAAGEYSVIGGGSGNLTNGDYSFLGGGWFNEADGLSSVTSGGQQNAADGNYSCVGGGTANTAAGIASVVAGGSSNSADSLSSTVAGGAENVAGGINATIGGGHQNSAAATAATVAGGESNLADGSHAVIGGGFNNGAAGDYAVIPGGDANVADGAKSFAAGHRAKAMHAGCFVWADTTEADFTSSADNQFLVRAGGGVGINTTTVTNALTLPNNADASGSGLAFAWDTYSSRRWKTDITPISNALDKVQRLRGVTYKWTSNDRADIGLIAEEVGAVIPEVVQYEDNGVDARSVDYARLVALLIEGMKEQQAQIRDLQSRLRVLERER